MNSDTEEESDVELEALLYSRIHYDNDVGTGAVITELNDLDESIGDSPDKHESTNGLDSGLSSGASCENAASPARLTALTKVGEEESVIIDVGSSSDESDTDGIIALSSPERVTSNNADLSIQQLSPNVKTLTSGEDSRSASDESDHDEDCDMNNSVPSPAKEGSVILVEEWVRDPPRHGVKRKYVPEPSPRNSESSDEDSVICEPSCQTLHINVLGSKKSRDDNVDFEKLLGRSVTDYTNSQAAVPKAWNKNMSAFYNNVDHSKANLSMEDILSSLPTKGRWKIDRDDLYRDSGPKAKRARYYERQCKNCRQRGHVQRDCPEPKKGPLCLCGGGEHKWFKCPKKRCLRCGATNAFFTPDCQQCKHLDRVDCLKCGAPGHTEASCPDIWRRFHDTVSADAENFKSPSCDVHRSAANSTCVNCAKKGHYLHHCRAYRQSRYPFSVLSVIDYSYPQQVTEEKMSRRRRRKESKAAKKAYKSLPGTPRSPYLPLNTRQVSDMRRLGSLGGKKTLFRSEPPSPFPMTTEGDKVAQTLLSAAKTLSRKAQRERKRMLRVQKRVSKKSSPDDANRNAPRGVTNDNPKRRPKHVTASGASKKLKSKVNSRHRGDVTEGTRRSKRMNFSPNQLLQKK